MSCSKNRSHEAIRLLLVGIIMLSSLGLSCGEAGDPKEPDFYITVKLKTGFVSNAVDRLEVVIYDPTILMEESVGEAEDGAISWETRSSGSGDEFAISMTNEYFMNHGIEVAAETWEIDVPFHGGADEGGFNVRTTVYWVDPDGEENDIGFGTGILELPLSTAGSRVTIEVDCRSTPDWAWTCITGCGPSVNRCDGIEDCGSGHWECNDGCCIAQ